MKFKDYINEKYINNNKEYAFLLLGRMPIAPKLWSRINKVKKIDNAYHVTDYSHIKTIYKIQGSKKQISTFTSGDGTVAMGIDTEGGVLFELSGESTLSIDGDAWTSLDRNGNRWWDLHEMSNGTLQELDKLKDKLQSITKDILIKTKEFSDILTIEGSNKITTNSTNKIIALVEDKFTGKQKAKFIKLALDEVEKYIKKIDLEQIIRLADGKAKTDYGNLSYFNEIVLHNIKVKNIYGVIPYSTNAQIKIREKLIAGEQEYDFDGWVEKNEIEDIADTKPTILSAEVAFGI